MQILLRVNQHENGRYIVDNIIQYVDSNFYLRDQMSSCGCTVIDCSSTRPRLSSSGVVYLDVVSTFQMVTFLTGLIGSYQF